MTNVLFIRDLIYTLERDFGQRMDMYVPLNSIQDYGTGAQNITFRRVCFQRAVLLSEILQRRFVHDVAFLTAGRNFAYGGLFDEGKRTIIIGGNQIPKGIRINNSCYITYLHERYDIEKVEELEHRCAYIITMARINTVEPNEILTYHAHSSIQWTGVASNG